MKRFLQCSLLILMFSGPLVATPLIGIGFLGTAVLSLATGAVTRAAGDPLLESAGKVAATVLLGAISTCVMGIIVFATGI